jgi:prepilin-type N-terminal cleavage/methylation domain-containing protein
VRTPRRAYTLLEVVLVMAVLAIVTSLAYPFAVGWFSGHKMTAASDQVRAKLTDAKRMAQQEGRPYRFSVKENTGMWRMAPEGAEFWDGVTDEMWEELKDVRFSNVTSLLDEGGDAQVAAQDGTRTVTFLPDGSARANVRLGVSNPQGQPSVVLQIRADTGTVTEEMEAQ